MNDNLEFLPMAAKAARILVCGWALDTSKGMRLEDTDGEFLRFWNPSEDDGEAFRLAVELDIHLRFYRKHVDASLEVHGGDIIMELFTANKSAATRRAIVRAAAAIGEAMP